jgi:Flp pilus assembly pilin Flp
MADLKLLLKDESGLELSEYAVAAALVVIPLVLALDNLGDKIGSLRVIKSHKHLTGVTGVTTGPRFARGLNPEASEIESK